MNPSQPMLEGAVKKYEKFLDLLAAFPDRSLSPTLLIDLPWHVHQVSISGVKLHLNRPSKA